MFRNHARLRVGPNPIFLQIEHRSRTFFRLSPTSNVKFGLLRGGAMAQWPPLHTPLPFMAMGLAGLMDKRMSDSATFYVLRAVLMYSEMYKHQPLKFWQLIKIYWSSSIEF